MGLLDSLHAEIQRLNPANLITEIESAQTTIASYESRFMAIETGFNNLISLFQQAVPAIEAAVPQATPELTALLTGLKGLQALETTQPSPKVL